jgi:adenylate kinase family enzyme
VNSDYLKHPTLRVSAICNSGSGKTTVSKEVSRSLNIKHVELDFIHWGSEWKGVPNKEFRDLVEEATNGEPWVVDGNYSRVRDIVRRKSALVVWLDLSFKIVFWRKFLRTVIIMVTRKKLWNSDIVVFDALFGPGSMPLWVMKTGFFA